MRAILLVALFATGLLTGCASVVDARSSSEVCQIHHQFMRTTEVSGTRSTTPPSQEYIAARIKSFIHAYPVSIPYKFRRSYMIYVCADCVRAEQEWIIAHPGLAPAR